LITIYPKVPVPEILVGIEVESSFSFAQTENSQDKRFFLKGGPNSQAEFSNKKCFVPFTSFYQFQGSRQL